MESDAEPTLILAHLFLGSKVHARDRELLQRLKITHILNVRCVEREASAVISLPV